MIVPNASPDERRVFFRALVPLLLLAFALRFGSAIAFPNIDRPDEIYQTIEPAHRLVTGWGVVTWEWRDGIRSWMFPGFLAGLMQLAEWLGFGRDGYIALITATLSLLSIGTVAVAFALGWRHSRLTGAVVCGTLAAIWPDLVYFGPKTLLEVQGGNLLGIAVGLAALLEQHVAGNAGFRTGRALTLIGALLGLAFCLRIQLAPALVVVAVWACGTERRRWLVMLAGGAVPVAALGLIDLFTRGSAFQSVWKYVEINIVEARAVEYGVESPAWYFAALAAVWGTSIVPLALLFAIGASRAALPAATAAAVVLAHSAIAHKEFGFIYAALPPAMIAVGIGACELLRIVHNRFGQQVRPGLPLGAALIVLVWLAAIVTVHGRYRDALTAGSANLQAMRAVHALPDICGLGLWYAGWTWYAFGWRSYDIGWTSYAFVDRAVPTYLPLNTEQLEQMLPAANYLLATKDKMGAIPDAAIVQCWDSLCLLHTPRNCVPVPRYEINTVFEREGY